MNSGYSNKFGPYLNQIPMYATEKDFQSASIFLYYRPKNVCYSNYYTSQMIENDKLCEQKAGIAYFICLIKKLMKSFVNFS